jgi:hypothetical protein
MILNESYYMKLKIALSNFVKIFRIYDHLINTLLSRFETLEFYQIERGHQLNNQNDH